jgi:serine/threonine-protein kinase PRP4
MLVTNDFTAVKICDFGSAMDMRDSGNNIPTPYLVSRFYRAPEIILGHTPAFTMDLWSVAVTVAELFLGRVLFNGTSNNDMLLKIMQVLGPLPLKQIKHHTLACRTYPLPQHFSEHHFLEQATDPVTGNPVQKQVSLQQFPTKPLQSLLLKAKSSSDSRVQVLQLSDLLKKCLALDPTRRISLKDAMKHDFFQKSSSIGPKEEQADK